MSNGEQQSVLFFQFASYLAIASLIVTICEYSIVPIVCYLIALQGIGVFLEKQPWRKKRNGSKRYGK